MPVLSMKKLLGLISDKTFFFLGRLAVRRSKIDYSSNSFMLLARGISFLGKITFSILSLVKVRTKFVFKGLLWKKLVLDTVRNNFSSRLSKGLCIDYRIIFYGL